MRCSTSKVELVTSQSGLLLFSRSVMSDSCDPVDGSPPDSSVRGVSPARILERVAVSVAAILGSICLENWVVSFVFLEFTFLSLP